MNPIAEGDRLGYWCHFCQIRTFRKNTEIPPEKCPHCDEPMPEEIQQLRRDYIARKEQDGK